MVKGFVFGGCRASMLLFCFIFNSPDRLSVPESCSFRSHILIGGLNILEHLLSSIVEVPCTARPCALFALTALGNPINSLP
jgi:hypothetical protein